jgi:hypothetical protein
MKKSWFFKKINNIDKRSICLKEERRPKLIKLDMKRGLSQQTPMKSRTIWNSLKAILK